jgi:transcription initiation factor TFIIH subunit 4
MVILTTKGTGSFVLPFFCFCLVRSLSSVAQQIVLRLVFVNEPALLSDLGVLPHATVDQGLNELESLSILQIEKDTKMVQLNEMFRKSLQIAFSCSPQSPISIASLDEDARLDAPSIDALDAYAAERWDRILRFIADPSESITRVSRNVQLWLIASDILGANRTGLALTQHGFDFLVRDTQFQVFHLIKCFFTKMKEIARDLKDADPADVVIFACEFSFLHLGECYHSASLNHLQSTFLRYIAEIGLAFIPQDREDVFYPTRLGLKLPETKGMVSTSKRRCGVLVVESNFVVHAHTDSYVHQFILMMFSTIQKVFPNLIVSRISRESVLGALADGIGADHIIQYLKDNSREGIPIPSTLVEKIHIWDAERTRVKDVMCVCFKLDVSSDELFEILVDSAKLNGNLIFASDHGEPRYLVVQPEAETRVRELYNAEKLRLGIR